MLTILQFQFQFQLLLVASESESESSSISNSASKRRRTETKTKTTISMFDKHSSSIQNYRIAYPHPEDYVIELLVNPCGVNNTRVVDSDSDKTIPLGYDCCMNKFGRGEFGFLKYLPNSNKKENGNEEEEEEGDITSANSTATSTTSTTTISTNDNNGSRDQEELSYTEIFQKRIPAGPNEVLHNMIIVDEKGIEIPHEYSRRADDHTIIDESCMGLRKPFTSCLNNRLRAIQSPFVPDCWDHNQTVDATVSCYTPNGEKNLNCMQVSYSQNTFINTCGGGKDNNDFSNDANCGTYIEIHRSNGSPYDPESTTLSQTKINTRETNGMTTTTIDLSYKGNANRILCAYNETKIRIGSMVRIKEGHNSPQCCCPPRYNKLSKHGSFFCPRKKGTDDGPFADAKDLLVEQLDNDRDQLVYPYCHDMDENEDILMCSREIGGAAGGGPQQRKDLSINVLDMLIGSENSLFYTDQCSTIQINERGKFTSDDLNGEYGSKCSFGDAFKSCGGIVRGGGDDVGTNTNTNTNTNANHDCFSGDSLFHFQNKIGKITMLPKKNDEKVKMYGVTFNDGRTEYYFPKSSLELQEPYSNYELWFVQRNRFEKILQKRKGFRVVWPECTFDQVNDRYFPYAEINPDGNFAKVLVLNSIDND